MTRAILVFAAISILTFASAAYFAHTGLTGAYLGGMLQATSQVCAEGYEPRSSQFSCQEVSRTFNTGASTYLQSDAHRRAGLFLALSALTFLLLVVIAVLSWLGIRREAQNRA